ncbi:MAG: pilus assembly protein TadG-related protein [Parvibaculaceae bacterium]
MTRLKQLTRRFLRNSSGQAAIIFSLASIPLVVMLGMAVDYSNLVSNKKHLQATLDAAALASAAAYAKADPNYEAVAQKFFNTNAPEELKASPPVVSVKIDKQTLQLKATVETTFHNTIMSMVGQGTSKVNAATTVSLPVFSDYHKGEIVFVLDYSGSMDDKIDGKKKYISMRDEATKLINTLSQNGLNTDVKFGVVPFSGEVYATMPKKYWYNQGTSSTNYTSCTRDRKYSHNITDTTPNTTTSTHASRWGQPLASNDSHGITCSAYATRNLLVRPLTTDHVGTVTAISNMLPYNWTHIAVGMEFGWHLISPNEPFNQGVAYGTENTLKAIVLLTDGAQTEVGWGSGTVNTVSQAEKNLETICTNVKAKGVRVLTVAYDLYDNASTTRLKNCASSAEDAFNVKNTKELASAFGVITNKLAKVMYIAK